MSWYRNTFRLKVGTIWKLYAFVNSLTSYISMLSYKLIECCATFRFKCALQSLIEANSRLIFDDLQKKAEGSLKAFYYFYIYEVCSKQRWLFSFLDKYLFCPLQSKPPYIYNVLVPTLFSNVEALLICAFWYGLEFFVSLIIANPRPFIGLFNFGNRKNSCMIMVWFLTRNLQTSNDMQFVEQTSVPHVSCPKRPNKL